MLNPKGLPLGFTLPQNWCYTAVLPSLLLIEGGKSVLFNQVLEWLVSPPAALDASYLGSLHDSEVCELTSW